MASKTIVVLGMHRSATSLVANGLHKAGVDMGKNLMPAGPATPQGFYEDMDFVLLNDLILDASGGDWANPPKELSDKYDNKINELIRYGTLWGWKDPRTTLTIEKYYDKLEDPILVCNFRKPELVADSLIRRGDKMSRAKAEKLARTYNKKLIKFLKERFT